MCSLFIMLKLKTNKWKRWCDNDVAVFLFLSFLLLLQWNGVFSYISFWLKICFISTWQERWEKNIQRMPLLLFIQWMKSLSFKKEVKRRDEVIMKCVHHLVVMAVVGIHLEICKCTSFSLLLEGNATDTCLNVNTCGMWTKANADIHTQRRKQKIDWVKQWKWKTSEFKCQKQIDIELEWLSTLLDTLYARAIEVIFPENTHIFQSTFFSVPSVVCSRSRSFIPPHSIAEVRVLLLYYFHLFSRIGYECVCIDSGTKCDKQARKIERLNYCIHMYMYVCMYALQIKINTASAFTTKWTKMKSFAIILNRFHSILFYFSFCRGISV